MSYFHSSTDSFQKDGTLGYLTKRIDRSADGDKIPMEDMCQLTERQTEYKYKSSYEQIAKLIAKYSYVPLLDLTDFYEQVFFSWLLLSTQERYASRRQTL